MNRQTVNRIKSETLRSEIKERNQNLIYSYTNEIYDELFYETERQGRPLGYMSIQYLGKEFVL